MWWHVVACGGMLASRGHVTSRDVTLGVEPVLVGWHGGCPGVVRGLSTCVCVLRLCVASVCCVCVLRLCLCLCLSVRGVISAVVICWRDDEGMMGREDGVRSLASASCFVQGLGACFCGGICLPVFGRCVLCLRLVRARRTVLRLVLARIDGY